MLPRKRVTKSKSDPGVSRGSEGSSSEAIVKKTASSLGWSCDQWLKTCVVEYAAETDTTGSLLMQKLFTKELVQSGRYHLVDGELRKCS